MVDCITKMNKYNEDTLERNRISENGRKKVLENHTQKQRVEFIINKYKEYKND